MHKINKKTIKNFLSNNALWVLGLLIAFVLGSLIGLMANNAATERPTNWLDVLVVVVGILSALGTFGAAYAAFYNSNLAKQAIDIQIRKDNLALQPSVNLNNFQDAEVIVTHHKQDDEAESTTSTRFPLNADIINMGSQSLYVTDLLIHSSDPINDIPMYGVNLFIKPGEIQPLNYVPHLPARVMENRKGSFIVYFQYAPTGLKDHSLSVDFRILRRYSKRVNNKWTEVVNTVAFSPDTQTIESDNVMSPSTKLSRTKRGLYQA